MNLPAGTGRAARDAGRNNAYAQYRASGSNRPKTGWMAEMDRTFRAGRQQGTNPGAAAPDLTDQYLQALRRMQAQRLRMGSRAQSMAFSGGGSMLGGRSPLGTFPAMSFQIGGGA